jgi:uncharacterized protein YbjT (DUF2867 family)
MEEKKTGTVVLSGASGFIGGLLREALSDHCVEVRCISRRPEQNLPDFPAGVTAYKADLLDAKSLREAFEGAEFAYYLVHSLADEGPLLEAESQAARNFGQAAADAGISRIIYLGALAQPGQGAVSGHIESRNRVGEILRASGVPVTEFRSSVVIGSGSMPFEVVRTLVERLPVMVTPRWVRMRMQPISSDDVTAYLVAGLGQKGKENRIYEIGGRDVVSYEELLRTYAKARSLRRLMVGVPVITPRLSSHWLRLVTPAHFQVAKRIVESTRHESIVRDTAALRDFPIRPMAMRESIEAALMQEADGLRLLETSEDRSAAFEEIVVGNSFIERRRVEVKASAVQCFDTFTSVGGKRGWYWADFLWRMRGGMDRLVGGPGLRRARNAEGIPREGGTLDFWRVQRVEKGKRLTLLAEMKLPGRAWLDFRAHESASGAQLEQTVVFSSRGAIGQLYWYAVKGLHAWVFEGMLREMARAAESASARAGEHGSGPSYPDR